MASYPPGPQKAKLNYSIDRKTYDEFVKLCSRKGFAPQVILEQAMKKFVQQGKYNFYYI